MRSLDREAAPQAVVAWGFSDFQRLEMCGAPRSGQRGWSTCTPSRVHIPDVCGQTGGWPENGVVGSLVAGGSAPLAKHICGNCPGTCVCGQRYPRNSRLNNLLFVGNGEE